MACCSDSKLTPKQFFILCLIASVHFCASSITSLQAPFYPEKAQSKNATATEFGFVFGIYDLVCFFACPLLSNFVDIIGVKLLLNSGVVLAGFSAALFGFLDYVEGPWPFVPLSLLLRALEAVGASAAVTSAFAIAAATFPDNMATIFAVMETCFGLGYVIGPVLGGLLYSLGGFKLPFLVMGSIMILQGFIIFFFLPPYPADKNRPKGKLLEAIKVPAVLMNSISVIGVSTCTGFYSATLEPHIRDFKLSHLAVGLVFVTHGGTYALAAPIVGRLCDKSTNLRGFTLFGSAMVVCSALLVGPAPFIPFEPSLPLVLIGLFCLGLSMATVLVAAFADAVRTAVEHGFSDDIVTYAVVSGLWAASLSIGDFIGPTVAGVLTDWVGFRLASMFIISVQAIVLLVVLVFMMRKRRNPQQEGEVKELEPLNPSSLAPDQSEKVFVPVGN